MCKYDVYVQSCKGRGACDIQVTNHNMLLMSQKLKACGGNDLLQDSNYIIIDEAHKLIDAANSTYGVELSRGDILVLTDILKDYVAKSKQEYCRFTDLLDKLEALTCRCSVGLDMIAVPGDTSAATISAIIADEAAIGMVNSKTTAVRVIPAIGKKVGEELNFGGLLGEGSVMPLNTANPSVFIHRGGRIPAPMQSLKN